MKKDKICLFITADNPISSLENRTEIQIILTNWRNSLKNRWQAYVRTYGSPASSHNTNKVQARSGKRATP